MSKLTISEIAKSVLAAAIGVQSNDNRKRDFERGSLSTYIIAGIIFTVLFVTVIVSIVSIVLL